MKYREWCGEYLRQKQLENKIGEIVGTDEENLIARLLDRINCLTRTYLMERKFGGKHGFAMVKVWRGAQEVDKYLEEKYQTYLELMKEKAKNERKLHELINSEGYSYDRIKQDKAEEEEKNLKWLGGKIEKFKVSVDDIQYKKIPWDQCREDSVELQEMYEELEGYLYQILLDKIDKQKLTLLNKDMWECMEAQDKETILLILSVLKDSCRWNISTKEFELIRFKLEHPEAYRMLLCEGEMAGNDVDISCEGNGMDKEDDIEGLIREDPELYALIKRAIWKGEIERKSKAIRKKLRKKGVICKRGRKITHTTFV